MSESVQVTKPFVIGFMKLYSKDPESARCMLVAAFIACYSAMDCENRLNTLISVEAMAKQVGTELFEDGEDFLSFAKQAARKHMGKNDQTDQH